VLDYPDFNLSKAFLEDTLVVTEELGYFGGFIRIDENSNELVLICPTGMNPETQNGRRFVGYRFESFQ
jgi:hypothetical protein